MFETSTFLLYCAEDLSNERAGGYTAECPHLLLPFRSATAAPRTAQCSKLLVTIFRNLVNLVTIFRNLVKSRNKVRFGLAFTIAKRYYIHV